MIQTNADKKTMTKGQKKALETLETYLNQTLHRALPEATIRLDGIEFYGCPHCALEAIEKYGVEPAIDCGVDGDLSFFIGSPSTPFTFASLETIERIRNIRLQLDI